MFDFVGGGVMWLRQVHLTGTVHISLLDMRQYAGIMAEVPFIAEKDYLAELIKYVRWNLFLAFNNKQELEEEGKPTRSLLCFPGIGNKVPSMPEDQGVFILELYYPWQAFRFSKKRYMTLLQKKIHKRNVNLKGSWVTYFMCLLITWSPSSWLLIEEIDIYKLYYTDEEGTVSWIGFPFCYISICRSIINVTGKLSFPSGPQFIIIK